MFLFSIYFVFFINFINFVNNEILIVSGLQNETEESEIENKRSCAAWSPIRSVGSLVGMEADPNTDPDSALDYEIEKSVFRERDDCLQNPSEPVWEQADNLWSCVEAGAVFIDTDQLPNWYLNH